MELLGENQFKVAAFRKAASAIELDPRSLSEMDDILKLKGIGKGTGAVITDLLNKGESELLAELEQRVPKGLIPLLKIPGLGGKRIAKLHEQLSIDSVETLRAACLNNEVSKLPGFGKKTEENLLREIELFELRKGSFPHWQLHAVVRSIEKVLCSINEIERFSVAGSYRRTEEQSSDVDFIIATTTPKAVREKLIAALPVEKVIGAGDAKLSITLDFEDEIDADFRFVTNEQFATALHHFTGSKDHNVKMRQIAKEKGMKISEYGVEDEQGNVTTFETETAFFEHFNFPFIPPAIRQNGQELTRLKELPTLIKLDDIRSDLHMHTTWSDGAYSIEEMAEAARAKGYSHIAITDHSHYLKVANGLTPARLVSQIEEIRTLNEKYDDFTIFCGTEMDILPDGSLDFEDSLLEQLDFVIASIHSNFAQTKEEIMERLYRALSNPHVHMIAHPTGRIIGERDGYEVDIPQLMEWAKTYGKILELNANPHRLDLKTEYLVLAQEMGVNIAINTDAHAIDHLNFMETGVHYAQKAWLNKEHIVNTWTVEQFKRFIKQK